MISLRSETISWGSKKQQIVALLSMEAKYRGAVVVECEIVWLKRLQKDMNESVDKL